MSKLNLKNVMYGAITDNRGIRLSEIEFNLQNNCARKLLMHEK